jgi:hypothetical protein
MPFNISNFSSKINKYGLARDNLFFVTITAPNLGSDMPQGDLSFFCRSVDLPSLSISTVDIMNQGYGLTEKRPSGLPFDNLNTVFMIDTDFRVKEFFHRWVQAIVNFDNSKGFNREYRGMLPFEVSYKDQYKGTVQVAVYSYQSESVKYVYKFDNAFPVGLGNITTAWENNDSIMAMPIQFAYDIYKVDGFGSSIKASRVNSSRGFGGGGTSGFFTSLGNFGQALDAIGIDTPIQDIVNQYSLFGSQVNSTLEGIRGGL